ncbi:MAG: hypothetical protein LBD81_02725 [Holosporaceae bacterium]|jgi:hypothetical protein|nr:hypothetical protein [Holosporaceae bacterium]
MKRLIINSVLVAAMAICTVSTSDAWIFSRNNTATKSALGGQDAYFQSIETSAKAALKAAKDLKSAFLDFSDARTILGTAGKGEIEAIIYYLDAVQAAAKDIRQAERDDVMVPKVAKTFSAPVKCFATITMLIERHLTGTLQAKSTTQAKVTKFYTAFAVFMSTVLSISLPQSSSPTTALVDYALQLIDGLRSLASVVSAFQNKLNTTAQLQQALVNMTQQVSMNSGSGYTTTGVVQQPTTYSTVTSYGYATTPAVSTPQVAVTSSRSRR